MKQSDMPKPSNLLKGMVQSDANLYSALWVAFRLCFRLRENGVLNDEDIHSIFDLNAAQQLAPENLREEVRIKLRNMRDQCLAQGATTSSTGSH